MWLLMMWGCAVVGSGTDTGPTATCEPATVSVAEDALEGLDTCDQLGEAYYAEELALRACTTHADCGQLSERGSCGCTNAAVLACTADPGRLYALADALELDCDGWLPSTSCECRDERGFLCSEGVCVWNVVDR